MLLIFDGSGFVAGFQSFPIKTDAAHKVVEIKESDARKIVGRAHISDLDDIDALMTRINAEDEIAKKEKTRNEAKRNRDLALDSMTYDFGDGRVMQTRPQDEANIVAAIELMDSEGLVSVDWVMADNTKHAVTAYELREALRSGRLKGLAIWNDYNP